MNPSIFDVGMIAAWDDASMMTGIGIGTTINAIFKQDPYMAKCQHGDKKNNRQ